MNATQPLATDQIASIYIEDNKSSNAPMNPTRPGFPEGYVAQSSLHSMQRNTSKNVFHPFVLLPKQ